MIWLASYKILLKNNLINLLILMINFYCQFKIIKNLVKMRLSGIKIFLNKFKMILNKHKIKNKNNLM
jgi:hypothetical protein